MSARLQTKVLSGDWLNSGTSDAYGLAAPPWHSPEDRSLKIWDGPGGVMFHSFAGEDWRDIRDRLRAAGLLIQDQQKERPVRSICKPNMVECARRIWRESRHAEGTLAHHYLRRRGIYSLPLSIRFHPALKYKPAGLVFPALVAGVAEWPDRRLIAVHRIFLSHKATKAQVSSPKMTLGSLRGGAVRLGPHCLRMGLAEGVESGLSAYAIHGGAVWVALGSRMHRVVLPEETEVVTIYGDNGEAGHEAADKARRRFERDGKSVELRFPPKRFGDWNDALQDKHHAS